MKKKLKRYSKLLISIAITILVIILYYIKEFYLASVILIIYVACNAYLDIDKDLYDEKVNTLTTKIKANINDNISNMLYPLALIDNEGNILWANKRLKEELNLFNEYIYNKFNDGVDIFTYFRNKVVHPTRKTKRANLTVEDMWNILQIGTRYVELVVLYIINYKGEYSNRLNDRCYGEVEVVPWND